jgi:hypothetical protein
VVVVVVVVVVVTALFALAWRKWGHWHFKRMHQALRTWWTGGWRLGLRHICCLCK